MRFSKEEFPQKNSRGFSDLDAAAFANRCEKKIRLLKRWAKKNSVCCFRVYDRDIPQAPFAVDLYEFLPEGISSPCDAEKFVFEQNAALSRNEKGAAEGRLRRVFLKVFFYPKKGAKDFSFLQKENEECFFAAKKALSSATGISEERIVMMARLREKGGSQYDAKSLVPFAPAKKIEGRVFESGMIFFVNLSSHIDTGLFLDMRKMRLRVKDASAGKRVLNLFCHTSAFSVAALAGGATFVQGVDISNAYIERAKKNFFLNGFYDERKFSFERSDVFDFLKEEKNKRKKFDIIILDPPTFSNSKKTRRDLNLNRDWPVLVRAALDALSFDGALYFCANSKRLSFDEKKIGREVLAMEITQEISCEDFSQRRARRAWEIRFAKKEN